MEYFRRRGEIIDNFTFQNRVNILVEFLPNFFYVFLKTAGMVTKMTTISSLVPLFWIADLTGPN